MVNEQTEESEWYEIYTAEQEYYIGIEEVEQDVLVSFSTESRCLYMSDELLKTFI